MAFCFLQLVWDRVGVDVSGFKSEVHTIFP